MTTAIKKFIKWWKSFEYPVSDNYDFNKGIYKGETYEKHWCPLCGYAGTADNLRCHILNGHRELR